MNIMIKNHRDLVTLLWQLVLISACLFGVCQNHLCEFKVSDDTKENSFLTDLNTFDQYSSTNNKNKRFSLLSKAKINDLFRLEKTGKLYSAKLIDREQMCKNTDSCCDNKDPCTMSLSIAVTSEMLIEPRTFECRVLVIDVNDNAPQFPKDKIIISIKESEPVGSTFLIPYAIDLDTEKFSIKDYRLEDKSMLPPTFLLDQHRTGTNLNLQLTQKLDREKCFNYDLTLLAFDRGYPSKTGRMIIHIDVIDVNDNPPRLVRKNYVINHEESKFSTQPLLKIEATDEDENENARLFFTIIDENPLTNEAVKYFRVEQNTGKIFLVQRLDFEKQEKHKFFVEVSNNVGHVETATATVLVNVDNLNDERPVISIDYLNNNNNNANIKENDSRIKFVAIATVSDRDKGIGGQVHCRLVNFNDVFEIQSKDPSNVLNKYHILTKVSLNRESMAYYELQMECEDKGHPVLREKALIKINVEDVNDNKPIIKMDNKISIKEGKPPGTLVTQISATDFDEGKNSELTFSIFGSEEQTLRYLEINPQTGELKTRVTIDREGDNEPLLSLSVFLTVTDKGDSPLSATQMFFVTIEDVNDNAPKFGSELIRFSVTENQPPRFTLGEIPVTDRDDTSQLRVSFAHSTSELSSQFVIFSKDNKYYLNTTRSLDREKEQNFSFKIIACDGKGYSAHTVTANVLINVIDENDHSPIIIFPQQNNSFVHKISYFEKSEFTILTVSAIDKDSSDSPNGKFYFQLLDDHKDLFTINSYSGRITTTRSMHRQDMGKYNIRVLVRDQGSPPKESHIKLTIEVDDSKSSSRSLNNDDDKEFGDMYRKSSVNYLLSKESLLITSLIILLLFLLICIFMILYMRHIRGLFPMLPDIFEGCTCFGDKRSKSKKHSFHKSVCDGGVHENRNLNLRGSPLDLNQQILNNNEGRLVGLYLNQYDESTASAHMTVDHDLPASQFRQYETMKYHHYSPTNFNSKPALNCNYDKLFYHHSPSYPCEDSFIVPIASSSNSNNFYDSRIKTIPSNLNRDLMNCQRIINNIDLPPLITDDQYKENGKERFSSNPCLKTDQTDIKVIEHSVAKTPDLRHSVKKNDKIDTYAVSYPKEQSTFV